jgi:hypothetical protein
MSKIKTTALINEFRSEVLSLLGVLSNQIGEERALNAACDLGETWEARLAEIEEENSDPE